MRWPCHLVFVLLLVGCASYESQTGSFRGAWNSGSTDQAAQIASREAVSAIRLPIRHFATYTEAALT